MSKATTTCRHVGYTAKRPPKCSCIACWEIYAGIHGAQKAKAEYDLYLQREAARRQAADDAMDEQYSITPYNATSFLVTKLATGATYVVDVADYNGKGSCTCDDFGYRGDPANRGGQPHSSCKHIRYVFRKTSAASTSSPLPASPPESPQDRSEWPW